MLASLKLDHCWICKRKFEGDSLPNEHHIIPQAFGGKDGPTVSLCAQHHDLLHLMARRLVANKPIFDLLTKNSAIDKRVATLASHVATAELQFINDPNRSVLFTVSLSGEMRTKLARLAKFHRTSQQKVVLALINAEFTRNFQAKTTT